MLTLLSMGILELIEVYVPIYDEEPSLTLPYSRVHIGIACKSLVFLHPMFEWLLVFPLSHPAAIHWPELYSREELSLDVPLGPTQYEVGAFSSVLDSLD